MAKFLLAVGLEENILPKEEMEITHLGHRLTLLPGTKEYAPAVVVECDPPPTFPWKKKIGVTEAEARYIVNQFLSSLSWARSTPIRETFSSAATALLRPGKFRPQESLDISKRLIENCPEPQNEKQRFALALYREAVGLNSTSYKFLGFFKVINVLCDNRQGQVKLINCVLPQLKDDQVKERIAQIQAQEGNVGTYLYKMGRCAVAHAYSQPLVNPDKPEHIGRLESDLPVIMSIAEYIIENILQVPRRD